MTGLSCVRLTNDSGFWTEKSSLNLKNTYSGISETTGNIPEGFGHNIGKSAEPVVMIIYNSRNGMLFVNKDAVINAKKLEEIGKLPYDWNGYRARPFNTALIDKCEKIISVLNHQPQIYPTGRQSIQFQYELEDRSYLEFEIFEEKTMCLYVPKRIYANAEEIKIVDSEVVRIKEIVEDFYGRNCTTG